MILHYFFFKTIILNQILYIVQHDIKISKTYNSQVEISQKATTVIQWRQWFFCSPCEKLAPISLYLIEWCYINMMFSPLTPIIENIIMPKYYDIKIEW